MGKTTVTRPRPREDETTTFKDAGLWTKLLLRARKGTTIEPYFVADIVESSLHTSMFCKLALPAVFLDHYHKNLKENISLEGPDGHKWPVMLGLSWDSKPCILQGWKEFAADYNLATGDQVVFFLLENSHFLVQVFDGNTNIKERGFRKTNDSQTKTPQQTEEIVKKTKMDVQVSGSSPMDRNPPANFGAVKVKLEGESRPARKVDANLDSPALHYSTTIDGKQIIHIESSEEEEIQEEEQEEEVPLKQRHWDAAKLRPKKRNRIDAEDQTQVTPEDLQEQNNLAQSDNEDQNENEENGSIMQRLLSTHPSSRSPPCTSPPSSPEQVTTLKRSRKLQRKTGGYEEDDKEFYTPSVVRLEKLFQLTQQMKALREDASVPAENPDRESVEMPTIKSKQKGNKVADGLILASSRRKQQSTKKQPRKKQAAQKPSKGMKRTPTTPVGQATREAVNAPQSTADIEATKCMAQGNGESKVMQSGAPVKSSRHKVEGSRDREEEKPANACPPEEETKLVYKRPSKIARRAPAKAPTLLYISRRRPVTAEEREAALTSARAYAANTTNKHFVMQLRTSQVYCGFHLGVPPEFVDAMHLPVITMPVTLFDFTGKKWEVEWLGDHPKRPGFHSAGWTKFVLENYLEEGDVCVFELPDPQHSNISVQIFPIVPLVGVTDHGWRRHYIIPRVEKETPDRLQS